MCLTEPQCGTDLGLIRTRAEPDGDGTYRITGTKIFITSGEHDLTENIVHLVLARLPDAPKGIKGISLFLVPKFLPKADGEAGPRNGVGCAGIEHKMGINGSATCVMNFEGAKGWLVGEPHRGMRAMFTMMNDARLEVGLQGLGDRRDRLSERGRLCARAPAGPRAERRPRARAGRPTRSSSTRTCAACCSTMRATSEGARALAYWVGMHVDLAKRHPDAPTRQAADDLLALMTPILKAYLTDQGSACSQPRRPDHRRPRLHPRVGHGAAGARRAHHPALRGRQRHPGARPGRAQAAGALRPLSAQLSSTR